MITQIIQDAWYGKEKLWKVFWFYKVIGSTLIGLLVEISIRANNNLIIATSFALYFVYGIWVLNSLFSCRFNSKNQKYMPKVVEIFVFVNLFFLLLSTFLVMKKFLEL